MIVSTAARRTVASQIPLARFAAAGRGAGALGLLAGAALLLAGGSARAQSCGDTLTANTTLTADLDCSGYGDTALRLGADNITLDGGGFTITAQAGQTAVGGTQNGTTVTNFVIAPNPTGTGVLLHGDSNTIGGSGTCTVTGNHFGVNLAGANNTIVRCKANHNTYGFVFLGAISSNSAVIDSQAQENGDSGIAVTNSTGTLTLTGNDLTGNAIGIRFDTVTLANSSPTIGGTNTFGNNSTAAIYGTLNNAIISGVQITSGSGGNGIALSGNDLLIENSTVTGRVYGVQVAGVGNAVTGCNVSGNTYGVMLYPGASSNSAVINNVLQDNSQAAVYGSSHTGALQISGNDLGGSNIGIQLEGTSGYTFDGSNPTVVNPAYPANVLTWSGNTITGCLNAFSLGGNDNTVQNVDLLSLGGIRGNGNNLHINNVSLTGAGGQSQIGLQLTGNNILVENTTVTGRSYGIDVGGNGNTVMNSTASGNSFGVMLYGGASSQSTVTNNNLQHNLYGALISNHTGALTFTGNDLTGSSLGVYLAGSTGYVFDGATPLPVAGNSGYTANILTWSGNLLNAVGTAFALASDQITIQNMNLPSAGGISGGGDNLLVDNVQLTGPGGVGATGISLTGNHISVENCTVSGGRGFGLLVSGDSNSINNCVSSGNTYGALLYPSSVNNSITNSKLQGNYYGIYAVGSTSPTIAHVDVSASSVGVTLSGSGAQVTDLIDYVPPGRTGLVIQGGTPASPNAFTRSVIDGNNSNCLSLSGAASFTNDTFHACGTGGFTNSGATAAFDSSIVYSASGGEPVIGSGTVTSTYSDLPSGWSSQTGSGMGNIYGKNPLFTNPDAKDFSLTSSSPAIEAANPQLNALLGAPPAPKTLYDMGAIQSALHTKPVLAPLSGATVNEGSVWTSSGSFSDRNRQHSWAATVNYGDGSGPQALALNSDQTFALSHLYPSYGTYTATVTVADNVGDSTSSFAVVEVSDVVPVVTAFVGATLARGATYSASGSFTDPGANIWTATVDYGDGSSENLPLIGKTFAFSHVYPVQGNHTVTVSVSDGAVTGSQSAVVVVNASSGGGETCSGVSLVGVPGINSFGMLLYEDAWPLRGDFDFNDQTLAYNYLFTLNADGSAAQMQVTYNLLAAGAGFRNGLYLKLPLTWAAVESVSLVTTDSQGRSANSTPSCSGDATACPSDGSGALDLKLVGDTRQLFANASQKFINTDPAEPTQTPAPSIKLLLTFKAGTALETAGAPFDVYLSRKSPYSAGTNLEIHKMAYAGTPKMDPALFGHYDDGSALPESIAANLHFLDQRGVPFVLDVPHQLAWMQEKVELGRGYLHLTELAQGRYDSDWYLKATDPSVLFSQGAMVNGQPSLPPVAQTVGSNIQPCVN